MYTNKIQRDTTVCGCRSLRRLPIQKKNVGYINTYSTDISAIYGTRSALYGMQ